MFVWVLALSRVGYLVACISYEKAQDSVLDRKAENCVVRGNVEWTYDAEGNAMA